MYTINPFSSKRGFTLIELLVVIAIIAILAAILFPVFAQAKAAAKKAVCLSNQKQMSLGWVMYSGDYDDNYCPVDNGYWLPDGSLRYDDWDGAYIYQAPSYDVVVVPNGGLLQPYMKNVPIQDCPIGATIPADPTIPTSYGINYNFGKTWTGYPDPASAVNGSQVTKPADTIVFADCASGWQMKLGRTDYLDIENNGYMQTVHGRHNGSANVGWDDGHAKNAKVSVITQPANWTGSSEQLTAYATANNLGFILKFAKEPGIDLTPNDLYYYNLDK